MREADTKARTTIWKDGNGGIDPCTATDEANEKLVVEGLGAAFPTHRVVGEEACSATGVSPGLDDDDVPTWIVDPIDGTQNFVHGLPLQHRVDRDGCARVPPRRRPGPVPRRLLGSRRPARGRTSTAP